MINRDEMRKKIEKALSAAFLGSKKLKLIFNGDTAHLKYFFRLIEEGKIIVESPGIEKLKAIHKTKDWSKDKDREVIIILTEKFNKTSFHGRMEIALEDISAIQ